MSDLTSILLPLAGTFPGWPAAETPTPVQSLIVLVGIPLLVGVVITILVFANHLARRGRGEQMRMDEPLWVGGGGEPAAVAPARAAREITEGDDAEATGGASVRW